MQDIVITTSTGETRGLVTPETMKQWWLGKQLSGHRGIWLENGGENLIQRCVPSSSFQIQPKHSRTAYAYGATVNESSKKGYLLGKTQA